MRIQFVHPNGANLGAPNLFLDRWHAQLPHSEARTGGAHSEAHTGGAHSEAHTGGAHSELPHEGALGLERLRS